MSKTRIKELRLKAHYTQQQLADFLVVDKSRISKWENDVTYPSHDLIEKLAKFFNVSVDYLLRYSEVPYRNNLPTATVKIPLLGEIAAGIPTEAIENIEEFVYISEDMAKNGTFFALRVKGSSMEPRIYEGDIAIIRSQSSVNNGEIGAIKVNGDDVTLKKVEFVPGGIKLTGFNPSFTPLFFTSAECSKMPLIILGKLVEVRSTF